MSNDSDLSGENSALANLRRSRQPDLRTQQSVFAYVRSVPDLHQIVDLHPAPNASFADAGPVNARVGLDFHIVADDHRCRLRDFVPASFMRFRESRSRRRQ